LFEGRKGESAEVPSAKTTRGSSNFPSHTRKKVLVILIAGLLIAFALIMVYNFKAPQTSTEQPNTQPPALVQDLPVITSTLTLKGGSLVIVQTETGVKVVISNSSLPDGTPINVTSIYYGHTLPSGINGTIAAGIAFYDVKVTLASGAPLDSQANALVYISNPIFVSASKLYYWNESAWLPVNTQMVEIDTISGPFKATELTGTPLGVSGAEMMLVVPEYPLGSFLAVFACFAAFAIFKMRRKQINQR
jgi:hypothetical protein